MFEVLGSVPSIEVYIKMEMEMKMQIQMQIEERNRTEVIGMGERQGYGKLDDDLLGWQQSRQKGIKGWDFANYLLHISI